MQSVVWCVLGLCFAAPAFAAELTAKELAQVEIWLDRIHDEGIDPLRPAGAVPALSPVEGRPHLVLARSIRTFEAQLDTLGAVARGDVLPLLLLARHYSQLGLAQNSVEWYRHAYLADRSHEHRDEILREASTVAVASADSATIMAQAWSLARHADVARYADSLAHLLAAASRIPDNLTAVGALVDHLEPRAAELSPACVAELAWHRQEAGRVGDARELWREIVVRPSAPTLRPIGRALRGLADCSYILGDHQTAAHLYRLYRIHDLGILSAWSTYQLAGISSARGRYEEAIAGFLSLCERDDGTPWKQESCWRLAQARQLVGIQDALRPFRRDLHGR